MSNNMFNSIRVKKPSKSVIDLTHDVKMTGKLGDIMPILTMECVPGDKITLGTDLMARMAPMIAPIMHRVDITVHYFFVPNRLVWPEWELFITNTNTGASGGTLPPIAPYIDLTSGSAPFTEATVRLMDYFGIPTPIPAGAGVHQARVSAIPFAAYNLIYSEYYRDQNLEPIAVPEDGYPGTVLQNGNNTSQLGDWGVRQRSWEHDYFTSALPWAQKGGEVIIPTNQADQPVYYNKAGAPAVDVLTGTPDNVNTVNVETNYPAGVPANQLFARQVNDDQNPTINDLRRAFKLQEWLEKNARGGTRYIEQILLHFGVKSSDARLQRPEYITGVKSPIIISEVLNTTGVTSVDAPVQGNMSGHGVAVAGGNNGSYYCEEHGYIIGVATIIPKPAYQQGIPKHFLKSDPLEYFWPSFAHLGEQPILNQEIFAYTPEDNNTFGYVPRYAEYHYMPSRVAGDFRTSLLDFWHLGRIFPSLPALNKDFVNVQPEDSNRIFAVDPETQDSFYLHILNKVTAYRPMPKYGTPTI